MGFFSDINGFNEKAIKKYEARYDKKEEFSEVDFCTYDSDENIFSSDSTAFDYSEYDIFASDKDEAFDNYDGYILADELYNSIYEEG